MAAQRKDGIVTGPVMAPLPAGRLHFQHGPIDLVLFAEGPAEAVRSAYRRAWRRFETVLEELVDELPLLRTPLGDEPPELEGRVARRMLAACWHYRASYITSMAAVAGAVAEEILEVMIAGPIRRAPAWLVKDDSDLGDLLVTVDVGPLPDTVIAEALASGEREAGALMKRGLIDGVVLLLQGRSRVVGAQSRIQSFEPV